MRIERPLALSLLVVLLLPLQLLHLFQIAVGDSHKLLNLPRI